jgi:hypothetical protein
MATGTFASRPPGFGSDAFERTPIARHHVLLERFFLTEGRVPSGISVDTEAIRSSPGVRYRSGARSTRDLVRSDDSYRESAHRMPVAEEKMDAFAKAGQTHCRIRLARFANYPNVAGMTVLTDLIQKGRERFHRWRRLLQDQTGYSFFANTSS